MEHEAQKSGEARGRERPELTDENGDEAVKSGEAGSRERAELMKKNAEVEQQLLDAANQNRQLATGLEQVQWFKLFVSVVDPDGSASFCWIRHRFARPHV